MLQALKNRINRVQYLFLLFCAVFLIVAGIGNTFSYVMTKTPTIINMFLNGLNPDGDLVLQKTVFHPYGEFYTIPSEHVFTFEVNLGAGYANRAVETTQGEKIANENGIVKVTVAPDGRTTIYDIDEGTPVTVTEVAISAGFTPDAVTKELTIQKYQDNFLIFHNQYAPKEADTSVLTVSGSKSLVGREWVEGDSFTFALEVKEDGAWKNLGTQITDYELVEQTDPADPEKTILVPKTDFDKFHFTELIQAYQFSNAGTYSFRVTETEGTIGGVTYDKAESKFDILVGDADMDGYLEIQSVSTTSANTIVDGTTVNIGFENCYAPIGSTEAFIEIKKYVDDNSGQNKSAAGYSFELYDTADNLLFTSEATDAAGETSIHLVYEPTAAGKTFEYVLKESRCGEKVGALTYDDATYPLKVTVVDNLDGTVSAYIYDSDFAWDIDVVTDHTGIENSNTLSIGTEDTNLENTDQESAEDANDTTSESDTVSGGDAENITNESNAMAEENESIEDNSEIVSESENVNSSADSNDISADSSEITTSDEVDIIEEQRGTTTSDMYNTSEQESKQSTDGIATLSDSGTDDIEDALSTVSGGDATTTSTSDNVSIAKRVTVPEGITNTIQKTFTNHYDPVDASVVISGRKSLSGRGMNPGEFTFQMYLTDSTYVIPEGAHPIREAINSTEENFAFDALSFDKVGTSYYVVKEDATTALGGITYDSSLYLVKVVVTDMDGVLNAAVLIMDSYGKETEILFKNSYKASQTYLPLSGRKSLSGAVLQEGDFRFQLHEADENFTALGNAVQSVTNKSTGEICFKTITFSYADTYRYVVTEQIGTKEGMTYDSAKYCILVRVTDPGDGQLVISEYSITKDGNAVSEIVFANTYVEPEKPDDPNEPDKPDNPDDPEKPNKPDQPDDPDTPDEPIVPNEPDEPTDSEQPDKPLPPKTGDDSNVLLYSILMIVSGCMLLILLVLGRRGSDKE